MSKPKTKGLVWVIVNSGIVEVEGDAMPKPERELDTWFNDHSFTCAQFARWFGVEFPKGKGVYGCRIELAVIEKYRVVESKDYVGAERHTRKLVKVK